MAASCISVPVSCCGLHGVVNGDVTLARQTGRVILAAPSVNGASLGRGFIGGSFSAPGGSRAQRNASIAARASDLDQEIEIDFGDSTMLDVDEVFIPDVKPAPQKPPAPKKLPSYPDYYGMMPSIMDSMPNTFPDMSMMQQTMTRSARPPTRDSGGRPPMRDSRRMAPVRDSGSMSPTRDSGRVSPMTDSRRMPPMRDSGRMPSMTDSGWRPPMRDSGRVSSTADSGRMPPVADSGRMPPVADSGRMPPLTDSGRMAPVADSGRMPPAADSGRTPPAMNSRWMPPMSDSAMTPPLTDSARMPLTESRTPASIDSGRMPSLPESGYTRPVTGSESLPPPVPEGTKLYVGNLPWSVDNQQLAEVFQESGSVEVVEVIYDRDTNRSRGFAFVTMSTVEDARNAIERLDGYEIDGRIMRVNFPASTRPSPGVSGFRSERPPPRFGGGFNSEHKLFVGNLSWGVDDVSLGELFGEYGKVVDAKVIVERQTGRSRGFGFVTLSSASEVSQAITALDGAEFSGRQLRVTLAGEKPAATRDPRDYFSSPGMQPLDSTF